MGHVIALFQRVGFETMSLPSHIKDAIDSYIPTYEGWSTPERCCEMAETIIDTQPLVCVDIGVFAGRSTISQGFALRENHYGMTYGIDPWSPEVAYKGDDVEESAKWWKEKSNLEEMHRQAMKAVWDHKLEPWVTMIRARSENVIQLFPRIGWLNIDGGHGEESSCRDVELYVPKLGSGGYLFFDDTDWQSTQKALALIEQSCDLVNDTGKARTYRKR
jgi:hypothetical protein